MRQAAIFSWSGGKDSALALYKTVQRGEYDVQTLLTTVSEPALRVAMHGVPVALLEQQAASLGLPLRQLRLPEMPTMPVYEHALGAALLALRGQGATTALFGDIFLEDLRRYREALLAPLGLQAVFPLWGVPTRALMREFLGLGFQAITTCVDARCLDQRFVGRVVDAGFLRDLPPHVDPCGENGEFHTFVFDGPLFRWPVAFEKGAVTYRSFAPANDDARPTPAPFSTGFWYCDLLPAGPPEEAAGRAAVVA